MQSGLIFLIAYFSFLLLSPPTAPVMALIPPQFITASLVKTIETSQFSPSAPDPAGIDFIASKNKFIIADSEVDEMPIFAGKNVYEMDPDGSGTGIYSTLSFSHEPTGVSFDPVTNLYFFSDDDKDQITKVNPGADNTLGSSDDAITSFNTLTFGCSDAEGVFARNGKIYIPGGIDKKVFITDYSGTLLNTIDLNQFSITDFEGITVNPQTGNLFILARNPKVILELTPSGGLFRKVSITSLQSTAPADLVFAPSSDTADDPLIQNIYIVDRMVDNNANPNENDGRIYEISINSTSTTLTPTTAITSPAPSGTGKPGDANNDSIVDGVDYVIWLNNYNKQATGASSGDFDNSGTVDGVDYVIWLNNYNK